MILTPLTIAFIALQVADAVTTAEAQSASSGGTSVPALLQEI